MGNAKMDDFIEVQGVRVPWLIYGTAWKEERTAELTGMALAAGFVAIDTANQRKHYVESAVGDAVAAQGVARAEVFLQTKFTYQRGQDHRLPFDPRAGLATQVAQSFANSLEHLRTDYIDSYLLHGPWSGRGWQPQDREVWGAMEALHRGGRVRILGVSNVALEQLAALCDEAGVAPALVQNRCFARTGWDRGVRAFCRERGIVYQGFSLLTANQRELALPAIAAIADKAGATIPQVVFRFARAVGIVALTGTTDPLHMKQDLEAGECTLGADDVATIEHITG
jgi:diketogulonate reductase-like aldo/keto reductase